jgi:hypothetical protein
MLVVLAAYLVFVFALVRADPIPPTTVVNESKSTVGAAGSTGYLVNFTGNGTHAGGYIFNLSITSKVQNKRWKAFVGSVSGKLTLDDGDGYTIFDWDEFSGTVGGEVYATRTSTAVSWVNINCTWGYTNVSNKTVLENENQAMYLNSSDDNITRTFNDTIHPQLVIGSAIIPANSCFSTKTYNASARNTDYVFHETLLYDGTTDLDGNLIYTTVVDTSDVSGYRNDTAYDFQMIVPENGSPTWNSATPYYFYVELEE